MANTILYNGRLVNKTQKNQMKNHLFEQHAGIKSGDPQHASLGQSHLQLYAGGPSLAPKLWSADP